MIPRDIARGCYRRRIKTMHQRKTGGGIGYISSWRVDNTQELKNPTEESRNR
jgi:hypothetical protein